MGTVVNVYNSGASDLLHVVLNSSGEMTDGTGKVKPEQSTSERLVWVPFVEAIVPNVDMLKREMLITPPKGLLELNIRADERSKKERRQLVSHPLFLLAIHFKSLCFRSVSFKYLIYTSVDMVNILICFNFSFFKNSCENISVVHIRNGKREKSFKNASLQQKRNYVSWNSSMFFMGLDLERKPKQAYLQIRLWA